MNKKERRAELVRLYRQEGLKAAFAKWRYNFIMFDTPEHQLNQKVFGVAGSFTFLVISAIVLTWQGRWYIGVALAFTALVQYADLKGTLKQRKILKEIKENQEVLLKAIQGGNEDV